MERQTTIKYATIFVIIVTVVTVSASLYITMGSFNFNITVEDLPIEMDGYGIPHIFDYDLTMEMWGHEEIIKEISNTGSATCCIVNFAIGEHSENITVETIPEKMILEPGESKNVAFSFYADETGEYNVNISATATKCSETYADFTVTTALNDFSVNEPVAGRELEVVYDIDPVYTCGSTCHSNIYFEVEDAIYGSSNIFSDVKWVYGSSSSDAYETTGRDGQMSMLMTDDGYATLQFTLSAAFASEFDTTGNSCAIRIYFRNEDNSWIEETFIYLTRL